jgi:D-threo-aldose 1-dehydrogenase
MERLGTDRFDAIFIHDIDPYNHGRRQWKSRFSEAMDGAYPALSRLKAEGAVRALGVGVNSCEVCEQCIAIADFDVFMLAGKLTPLDHSANSTLTSLCSRKDIIIIAAAPFNSGILAAGSRSKALYKEARPPSVILTKVRKLEAVCGEFGVSLGALALQFPLRQPAVASVLPGPRNSRQIREVCRWFAEEIPAALWSRLDSDPEFSGEAIVGGHGS